jgi:glycosyltransferase involved in cell wall biosynthesis
MWRSDKGVLEAFDLIADLSLRYPKVEFWIGQSNTWNTRDSQLFIEGCKPRLRQLQNINNVRFFDRIKRQKEYWSWINQADISFSTAFQEGFGLSMMEQEAAGIACVVPNAEAYPELHGGCLIVDRSKLSEGLQFLIQNPNERKSVSQSCKDNASKYDTSIWVENMVRHLN